MRELWRSDTVQRLLGAPLARFGALLSVCVALTGLGSATLPQLGDLNTFADSANPYFVPGQALYLYIWVPVVTLATCVTLLAPGLLLSLGMSRGSDSFGIWILKGFALSVLVISLMIAGMHAFLGTPVVGFAFALALALLIALSWAYVYRRNRKARFEWSFLDGRLPDLVLALLVPALTLVLLSPKFYWEDYSGDGAHLFVATLQYLQSGSPFWASNVDAELSSFPTFNAVLQFFASSAFMRLFGETAFAIRAVYLLGAMLLAVSLMECIRFQRSLSASWRVAGAVGAGLLLFAYALAFNATYDPYFSDIALPMGREPLIVVTFLGFALFSWMQRYAWMTAFAALSYLSGPNGLILMGFWTGAVFLVSSRWWPINAASFRSWPIKETAIKLGLIAGVVVAIAVLESTLVQLRLASFGSEFGGDAILQRLRYISIDTWPRFAYWIIPAGILPVFALIFWSWQDRMARALTLTILFYFGFFYVQGFRILPHHFAPIMLLPMIVLWRLAPPFTRLHRDILPGLSVVTCAVAALLIAPSHINIHRVGSQFSAAIQIEGVSLTPVDADAYIAFDELFDQAFPRKNTDRAPQERYIGASIAWYVQALQPKVDDQAIKYIVRRPGATIGTDETKIAEWEGWTVTSLDFDHYVADRDRSGIPSSINPILYVPRDVVFGRGERYGSRRVIDLVKRFGKEDTDSEFNANEGQ